MKEIINEAEREEYIRTVTDAMRDHGFLVQLKVKKKPRGIVITFEMDDQTAKELDERRLRRAGKNETE